MGSLNHMCHYFQNIIPVNYSIWQMGVIIVIMKRELVSSVCRIQSVVPHLPAKALLLNIKQHNHGKFGYSMCKHPGRYTVILTGKYVQGCMNTGFLVLWLSEQHKKPGCLRELGRQEASQCLALKEKMCFINWLTFQTI